MHELILFSSLSSFKSYCVDFCIKRVHFLWSVFIMPFPTDDPHSYNSNFHISNTVQLVVTCVWLNYETVGCISFMLKTQMPPLKLKSYNWILSRRISRLKGLGQWQINKLTKFVWNSTETKLKWLCRWAFIIRKASMSQHHQTVHAQHLISWSANRGGLWYYAACFHRTTVFEVCVRVLSEL